ncbi:hypothetical protein TNCT_444731 [Trichonephila clavata]|uniref:C-type lectin domain-containing protein n=1 Tax=Trichonephila clavata TaxID=2740835 RepID=A0A8X6GKE5_TRICU|nr:hypothetical protein TNCT_444731 [Trichonephila clavata]
MKIHATLITFVFASTAFLAVESCTRGGISFNTSCLYIKDLVSGQAEASFMCMLHGGTLVSVSSEEMLEILTIHTYPYRDSTLG